MTFDPTASPSEQAVREANAAAPPSPEYPSAEQSLRAARQLIGPITGTLKVIRRYTGMVGDYWRVEAKLRAPEGPDYEFEIEGAELDEAAYTLVDALDKCGFHPEGGS